MAKGVVGESELKRTISNDTNIFKETRSNAIQELLHLTVFFKSVPSGATEQILSKTLAKLCKLGFRNKRLFLLTCCDISGHTISALFYTDK